MEQPSSNQQATLTALQAGRLLSDVEHLSKTLDEHSKILKKIDDKLSSSVTREEFERYKVEHQRDIREVYLKRDDLQSLLNFWRLVTGNVAKIFAVAMVSLAIYATSQLVSHGRAIEQLKAGGNNQHQERGL